MPQQAVIKTPTGHIAWVVDKEGKAARRDLVVGSWLKDDWIIEKGLGAGEMVVVDGHQRLQPGVPVKAVPWTPGPGGPGAAGAPAGAGAAPPGSGATAPAPASKP